MAKRELRVGDDVLYKLTKHEADLIVQRRALPGTTFGGNTPREGDVVPAKVTRIFSPGSDVFNGQAFLDGNDTIWITSVQPGTLPGQWTWGQDA